MKQLTIDHNNGHVSVYNLYPDGNNLPIAYDVRTPDKVVEVLERCRRSGRRIKLHYGDVETGRDWMEEYDVTGYVGLSKGREARFPILVYNKRSMGGGSLMSHCVVKIKESGSGLILYQADNYQQPSIKIIPSTVPEYTHSLEINGEVYSNHKSLRMANILMKKLS